MPSSGKSSAPKKRSRRANSSKKHVSFSYAMRSFVGYLEGTHKSSHTIKSYTLDIRAFQNFITAQYPKKTVRVDQISQKDLQRYRESLKEKGLRMNTRRRKILTVTQFIQYLARRKKLAPEMASKIPAPHKIERIPFTVPSRLLIQAIRNLAPESSLANSTSNSTESLLSLRNRCLLWSLAETGCLVSEVAELRFEQWERVGPTSALLHISGKFSRSVPVSVDLLEEITKLRERVQAKSSSFIYLGFNKFGPLGSAISPRGVELLVKHYGPLLGYPTLTPRTFRHSVILQWFEDGVPQHTIQAWLGLKTTYAFRSYVPLLKSNLRTTSTSEKNRQESGTLQE